jgi:hypothetical protein
VFPRPLCPNRVRVVERGGRAGSRTAGVGVVALAVFPTGSVAARVGAWRSKPAQARAGPAEASAWTLAVVVEVVGYLGFRLDPPAAETPEVLVVAPAALLHPAVPQPDGTVYELVTGHPDRAPRELVFLAGLTVELRAWPTDTWTKVGIDPQAAAAAVVAGWQRGDLRGLRLGGLTAEEALALERPAMTYVRGQLGDRLGRQLARAYRRWLHPTSGRRPGDRFP